MVGFNCKMISIIFMVEETMLCFETVVNSINREQNRGNKNKQSIILVSLSSFSLFVLLFSLRLDFLLRRLWRRAFAWRAALTTIFFQNFNCSTTTTIRLASFLSPTSKPNRNAKKAYPRLDFKPAWRSTPDIADGRANSPDQLHNCTINK